MELKKIALLGILFSILESILGYAIFVVNANIPLIVTHLIIAIVILILAVLAFRNSNIKLERNLSTFNLLLVLLAIILGSIIHYYNTLAIQLIHFFIVILLISSFSVLYGTKMSTN